jgi:hypothetical protein
VAEIKVAVINASTVRTDAAVQAAVPALHTQVHRDFLPAWGVDADLTFVPKDHQPPGGMWWLSILDNTDQAGALGYHDVTSEGLPLGKVFAGTDKQYGLSWTVTASHELLEMLGDPDINLSAFVQTGYNTASLYSYEVCDPCEMDEQGYEINGVKVSDFVYPSWFEGFRQPGSTQFDHQKQINAPLKLLPGGYCSVMEIPTGLGWYQINEPAGQRARTRNLVPSIGARRERRMRSRQQWSRSVLSRS